MNEFFIILDQVLILLLILLVGYAAGKIGILDHETTRKLSSIILYITTPMTIVNSFFIEFTSERLSGLLWTLGFSCVTFALAIFIARFIFRRFADEDAAVMKFTTVFSNATYMGFPLMTALFGDLGVFYGSFYSVTFTILLFSYGFMLFGGKGDKKAIAKKVLTNSSMVAVYVGVIIFLFQIPVPSVVKRSVSAIGAMTMPASMLVVGGVISMAKLREVFTDYKVYFASAIRLIVMPLIGLLLVLIIGVPTLPATVILTALAMPAATSTTMFAEMAGRGSSLSSRIVAVSTVLSLITAPLVLSLVSFALS